MALKRISDVYFLADTKSDLDSITHLQMGSECFVIEEACEYKITSDGKWINQSKVASNSSAAGSNENCVSKEEMESAIAAIEIPSIDGLATKEEMIEAIASVEVPSVEGLASESYVNEAIASIEIPSVAGFASVAYVDEAVAKLQVPNNKYSFEALPKNTIIDERGKEFRIMCPADAVYTKQNVGETGNPNMYYMTFKAFAPEGATYLKEGDQGVVLDEKIELTAQDAFGRKYKPHWFALASYSAENDTWTYFGKNSNDSKYIGWTYIVEWYNDNDELVGTDKIRLNLSNLSCHNTLAPYLGDK